MTSGAQLERVAKIMARRGMCSRREAERLIDAGSVAVEGQILTEQGVKAPINADIQIVGHAKRWLEDQATVLINKPRGIVSTQPEEGQTAAWQLLNQNTLWRGGNGRVVERVLAKPWTMAVCGRLDRDSRGLLLLTQDGVLARMITGSHGIAKGYVVTVDQAPSRAQLAQLRGPFTLDGQRLKPMAVRSIKGRQLHFKLVEGKKHQIRRVCQEVGLRVMDLLREQIGPFTLGHLPEGQWCPADPNLVAEIRQRAGGSHAGKR